MEEKGKKLGLMNLVGFSTGNAIGTGIFVLLGYGIASAGRSISLAVIIASVFMLMTSWAPIGMSNMFVFRGGEYGVKTMLFPPLVSGMSSWFTVISALGFSSMSVSFTSYLCVVFPGLTPYSTLIAFIYTVLMFAATIKGSRFLTLIENAITAVLIIALVTFVICGLPKVNWGGYFSSSYDGGYFMSGFSGIIGGISIIAYACMGSTASVSMAAVTKNPKKNIMLSALVVTALLAVIYGLMAIVASGVLPYAETAGQNISVTAKAVMPGALFIFFVSGGGLCAIASSSLSTLGSMRYPLVQIADDGWLPAIFKKQTKSGYPYITFGLYFILAVIPLAMEMQLDAIVSLVMVPLQLLNMIACIACMSVPKKYPKQWDNRAIKIPHWLYQVCCVLGVICGAMISYNLFMNLKPNEKILSAISVVLLVGLSWLRIKQGAVDVKKMEANKQAIIEDAIKMADEN
ncbi:MAG: APC family permease [Oscillospiraceae bacterium]|nr:APC family permease [Oscillospiraceae bacterium]